VERHAALVDGVRDNTVDAGHVTLADLSHSRTRGRSHRTQQLTGEVEPSFCVLDDVLYDRAFFKSKQRQLLMNGRHDKIFTVISAQYLMDLAPSLRAQVDYV
jgi:hypothetical protein